MSRGGKTGGLNEFEIISCSFSWAGKSELVCISISCANVLVS